METLQVPAAEAASWNPALRPDSAPLQNEPWESILAKENGSSYAVAEPNKSDSSQPQLFDGQDNEAWDIRGGEGNATHTGASTIPSGREAGWLDSIAEPEEAMSLHAQAPEMDAAPLQQSQVGEMMEEAQHQQQSNSQEVVGGSMRQDLWSATDTHTTDPEGDFFGSLQAGTEATPSDDAARPDETVPLIQSKGQINSPPELPTEENSGFEPDFGQADGDDFFNRTAPQQRSEQQSIGEQDSRQESLNGHVSQDKAPKSPEEELDAKWKAAFGDDDLLEEEPGTDPSAFFGDDDAGFLADLQASRDAPDQSLNNQGQPPALERPAVNTNVSAAYQQTHERRPSSSYSPVVGGTQWVNPSQRPSVYANGVANPAYGGYASPQSPWAGSNSSQRPPIQQAQSFSNKTKGGYESPYDAPMDLGLPKRRPNISQVQGRASPSVAPPPRSSSIYSTTSGAAYTPTSNASGSPGMGSMPSGPPPSQPKPKASNASFFEDLGTVVKPRTQSSASRFMPSPAQSSPSFYSGTPPQMPPPPTAPLPQAAPPPRGPPPATQPPKFSDFGLVKPERALPFADTPPSSGSAPPPSNRYSPAPGEQQQAQQSSARYSPAPPGKPPQEPSTDRYAATGTGPPRAPSVSHVLPFQPRTSSPLARSASASQHYVPGVQAGGTSRAESIPVAMQRRASLRDAQGPPTLPQGQPHQPTQANMPPQLARPTVQARGPSYQHPLEQTQIMSPEYRNLNEPQQQFQSLNAPPGPVPAPIEKSPQKPASAPTERPQAQVPAPVERPQVQPRGPLDSVSTAKPIEAYSISRQGIVPAGESQSLAASANANQNFIVPTDGREHDPLQRWQGAPIICFGFDGSVVTSFPQRIPRFATNQRMPMVKCIPGEIKVSGPRALPTPESLATFPGPLKSKGKKKEVLEWLEKGVQRLLQGQPDLTQQSAGASKRDEERILLWRTLKVLVEHDGNVDGNKAAEIEMRKILSPEVDPSTETQASQRSTSPSAVRSDGLTSSSNAANPSAVHDLRKHLLQGEREKAVWLAVDQKLWGHAMLIASTLPQTVWKQVAQEFVRNDVKTAGGNSEPLAALYDVFAGNWEESVDELVPPSARAGLQMMSKSVTGGQTKNALDGLDRWRETLSLILGNRTVEDARALIALGQLLLQYGRPEAAHMCFIFSKAAHLFGGPEDAQASVVLLGANHRQDPFGYINDLDSLLLTEVYEYVFAVLSPQAVSALTPHLQAFKLYHAELATEHGLREQAQQYCDAISSTLKATTKMSPYYHPRLVSTLEELNLRLRQSPKDSSGSWISKPSIDKVSSSVWNKFTHFVAGEDSDGVSNASGKPEVEGPFAKINGETPPSISRGGSPSQNFSAYGGVYAQPAMSGSTTNLRYAPQTAQASQPRLSLDQGSPESVPSSPQNTVRRNPYAPQNGARSRPSTYSPERERYHPTPPVAAVPEPSASSTDQTAPPLQPTQSSAAINPQPGFQVKPGFQEHAARRDSDSSDVQVSQGRPPSPLAPQQPSNTLSPHKDRNSPGYQPRTAVYEPRSASYEPRSSSYAPRSALYQPRSYEPSPSSDSGLRQPDGRSPYEPQTSGYPFPAAREPEGAPEESSAQAPPSHGAHPLHQEYLPSTTSLHPPPTALGIMPIESEAAATDLAHPSSLEDYTFRQQGPSTTYEPLHPSNTQPSSYEPPSSGYEPPTSGYEPPSFNYEPPSYNPENSNEEPPSSPPRRRQMMDLDGDGLGPRAAALQSGRATSDIGTNSTSTAPRDAQTGRAASDHAAPDRAPDDAVRRAAEADAQRDAHRGGGRGWLGGWSLFNRGAAPDGHPPKAVRAKLGEQNQMYYDKEQRRWVNPNDPNQGPATARPPPPPMGPAPSRPLSAGPPAAGGSGGGMLGTAPPPPGPHSAGSGPPSAAASRTASPHVGGPLAALGPTPAAAPPSATGSPALSGAPVPAPLLAPLGGGSRPGTAMSNASDIDDLLGAPAAKKGGTVKKGKKRGGYVDVMAK